MPDSYLPYITALVAIYGAVLSTYNAVVTHRGKRRSLKVSLSYGISTPHGIECLLINVSNPSQVPVTLASVAIRLPDRSSLALYDFGWYERQLPYEIPAGQRLLVHPPLEAIEAVLTESKFGLPCDVLAVATDGTDVEYKSKKFKIESPRN